MTTVVTRGAASAQALGYAARATAANYIEDVFSTYLYTGNGSTQTITNGIDLSAKGGLVWSKSRSSAYDHKLHDTARGITNWIASNSTAAQSDSTTGGVTSANSDGFSLGSFNGWNQSGVTYASWTFRKQAKFFDVVTYTGTGSVRTVSHNLGSAPGFIIIKRTDAADEWFCYHRSLSANNVIYLNLTNATNTAANMWNNTAPTSTVFTVGTDTGVNGSGRTYVAYLFAHDAGGFGASGSDNVITCGTFTTDGSGNATVNLGYEPQWVMLKASSAVEGWEIADNMRGFTTSSFQRLRANLSNAEDNSGESRITNTGFTRNGVGASVTYIYIAIRRGPMRTPTSGTSVYSTVTYTGDGNADRQIGTTITPDLSIVKARTNNTVPMWADRLRGQAVVYSSATAAEVNPATGLSGGGQIIDTGVQSGIKILQGTANVNNVNQSTITYVDWNFRRAPGFFDEVCYTGTGSATTFSHNLGKAPELMIFKGRSFASNWRVYSSAIWGTGVGGIPGFDLMSLNADSAANVNNNRLNSTQPTASVFSVGTDADTNGSGNTYVAYLLASVSGVSKAGSYTGTGTTKQVDCGFTGGARFVLIKRADNTGDWYIWDSSRGIVAGNDPYLFLNSTALEVTSTDYVDAYSAGFELSSTAPAALNANGGTYIFFAIA